MTELLPLFLNLEGRGVVLVGAGRVAAGKLPQLLAAGACVRVIAPDVHDEVGRMTRGPRALPRRIEVHRRAFVPEDLDGAWLAVAAATPAVNRQVAEAGELRRVFVNAVDDPANASAFLSGVVRRDGVTLAISTSGHAPALTSLLREGLDALLPGDLRVWLDQARAVRGAWRIQGVPMNDRKPLLLRALNELYEEEEKVPSIPWLSGPEDSWL